MRRRSGFMYCILTWGGETSWSDGLPITLDKYEVGPSSLVLLDNREAFVGTLVRARGRNDEVTVVCTEVENCISHVFHPIVVIVCICSLHCSGSHRIVTWGVNVDMQCYSLSLYFAVRQFGLSGHVRKISGNFVSMQCLLEELGSCKKTHMVIVRCVFNGLPSDCIDALQVLDAVTLVIKSRTCPTETSWLCRCENSRASCTLHCLISSKFLRSHQSIDCINLMSRCADDCCQANDGIYYRIQQ
ncbi:hypothetical protein Plhal304r1_c031g0100481 [Plasmopara halstedii]